MNGEILTMSSREGRIRFSYSLMVVLVLYKQGRVKKVISFCKKKDANVVVKRVYNRFMRIDVKESIMLIAILISF